MENSKALPLLFSVILFSTLTGCGLQGCGNQEQVCDSDSIVSHTVDTALVGRLTDFVAQKNRFADEQLCLSVFDLTVDTAIFKLHGGRLIAPASCLKLLTAVAALKSMGMDYEYRNRLSLLGENQHGVFYGTVFLRMDDDPLFESFSGFVQALRDEGIRRIEGEILFDLTRTDTLKAHPSAAVWDIPYHKLPLLLKGEQRVKQEFLYQLSAAGITFRQNPLFADPNIAAYDPASTPFLSRLATDMSESRARTLAEENHRLTDVVTPMLLNSSNIKADALLWHLNHVYGRMCEGNVLHAFLKYQLGIDYSTSSLVINDGSGLSPDNRLTADFLVQLLRYTYQQKPIFQYFIDEALPTPAGGERCGSLTSRMAGTPCVGRVFCKTGTLVTIGGSGLAGYAKGANGHWYAFAILNIDTPVADARIFQDKFCTELVK